MSRTTGPRVTPTEDYLHNDSDALNDLKQLFFGPQTPFEAIKTASQSIQFATDPSFGLTRDRYFWNSNGSDFDSTNFSNDPGEIGLNTTATGSDTARLRSSFAGQYSSGSLAEPGLRFSIDADNVTIDANGLASISHGDVKAGVFWWDTDNTQVDTGFGLQFDSTGAEVFWVSGGSHRGDSPIAQSDWNIDKLSGEGGGNNPSGIQFDPSDGWILNCLYTWYNAGKIRLALADPVSNRLLPFHDFNPRTDAPGSPSLETANLPIQFRIDNGGTATALGGAVGGLQFTLYGGTGNTELRDTPIIINNVSVTTLETDDPTTEPGDYVASIRRQADNGDMEIQTENLQISATQTIVLYQWVEFDDATALSGTPSFNPPNVPNPDDETKIEYDTAATGYSPAEAVLEAAIRVEGGTGPVDVVVREGDLLEQGLPIGATRVFTAVDVGNNSDLDTVFTVREGF